MKLKQIFEILTDGLREQNISKMDTFVWAQKQSDLLFPPAKVDKNSKFPSIKFLLMSKPLFAYLTLTTDRLFLNGLIFL